MQASQLLEGLEPGATSRAVAVASGTIDDLLQKASQQLECSSEEPVQQATIHRKRWWKLCSCCKDLNQRQQL